MMDHGGVLALTFLEPWGLLGLVAPLVLVLLGLARHSSREVFLGTVKFFRADTEIQGTASRWRLPAWLVAAVVALVLGALAMARPGYEAPPPRGVVLDLVIDESPSMFLPVDPQEPGGPRRIDTALESFQAWAEEWEANQEGDVFIRVVGGALLRWKDLTVPDPGRLRRPEPLWPALDRPGTVWITDHARANRARVHAGVFASGGAAVPGPISAGPAGDVIWRADGQHEFRTADPSAPTLFISPNTPDLVRELAEIWADDRGLQLHSNGEGVALAITTGGGTSATEGELLTVGRDGWQATVRIPGPEVLAEAGEPWLLDPAGRAVVTRTPGEVRLWLSEWAMPPDDLAAFAVSWTALFDLARLTPLSVLEVGERQAAGAALADPPQDLPVAQPLDDEEALRDLESPAARLRSILSGLAALTALLALVLLARSERGAY